MKYDISILDCVGAAEVRAGLAIKSRFGVSVGCCLLSASHTLHHIGDPLPIVMRMDVWDEGVGAMLFQLVYC